MMHKATIPDIGNLGLFFGGVVASALGLGAGATPRSARLKGLEMTRNWGMTRPPRMK